LVASSLFVKDVMVYGTGNTVSALLPLMLLPVLTRYLTPTDYGLVATSVVLVQVAVTVIGLNTSGLIIQSQFTDDFETRKSLLSTNVLVASMLAVALVIVTVAGGDLIEGFTEFPANWTPLLVAVPVAVAWSRVYDRLPLRLLPAQQLRHFLLQDLLDELLRPLSDQALQALPHRPAGLTPPSRDILPHEASFLSTGLLPGVAG